MAETIIINAATREIKVPDSEINFGVAGERKIERKHFRIEGRTYKGVDLADGFAWKVSCENAAKKPCADLIDSIVADATGIEFDWVVGAAPMAFKGELKFSVCAKRTNSLAEILNEWHSRIGTGIVNAGLEATVEDIGGYDLAAQLQQEASQAKANAEAAKDAQEAAESARDAASGSASAAAGLASVWRWSAPAASSASAAASAAKTAGDAAAKVVNEGVAEKLTEMQNIQKDVSTKAQTAETAAKNADTAKTAAQNAQKAAEKSAGNAANSESAAKTSAEQAAAARDTAQELAGRVIVDDALSDTSASPVQNKVIFAALAKKQDVQRVTFVINDTDGGLDAVVAD